MRWRIKRQLTSVGRIGENIIRFGKEDGARSKPMTTASIPELRKAHTRTRAQLARAAVRYGKRALAGRGSGEDGPPSDQEVALLRELLAAADAMTGGGRGNTGPPPTGNHSDSPGRVSPEPTPIHCRGCGGQRSGWTRPQADGDQAATIEAGKALQEAAIVVCERGPHRLRPGRQGG